MMKDNTSLNEGIFVNQVGNPTTFVYWSAIHEYAKKDKLIPLLIRKEIKLKVNKWTLISDYRLEISFVVWKTGSCIHAFVSTDKNL